MRSLWIATVATAALLPAMASAQAVSSANSHAGSTFSHAMAGRGGAFSHAQSGPVVRPMPAPMPAPMPQHGGWNGPRNGPGGMQPVGPRNGPGGVQPRPNLQPGWIDTRGGIYRPNGGAGRNWTKGHTAGQGSWNGQRWVGGSRWGGRIDGRWHSGAQAPGGWKGYRRPYRGWTLPSYWFAPNYYISDFGYYGLGAPPVGYNWSRYYDDAVLVDGRGRVYDSVSGLDWDRYDGGYAYDDSYDDGESYYADGVDDDYGPRGRDDRGYRRRDDGVGGAVVGGVLGGVAGNVIAKRGDKLAGTLIGAGAGAIAGAAIDRAEDRGRGRRMAPPYADGGYDGPPPYAGPGAPYGYPAPGPMPHTGYAPSPIVAHGGGYETRVFTSGGYAGYGYYGGTTTTVTVMPTTTETVETITVYDTQKTRTWRAPVKRTKILRRTPSKILSRSCNC